MQNGKLRLDVEDLSVESFTTAPVEDARGTVHGAQESGPITMCQPSYCVLASCAFTHCNTCHCGGGGGTATEPTCNVTCHTTDPSIIE